MHQRIRELRKRKGLTMQAPAEAAGTSQQQIDRLEKGQRRLTVEWLERLSKALDCSMVDLLPATTLVEPTSRTAKAKVVGEITENGEVRWWNEDERYTLVFGRPGNLINARLFGLKIMQDDNNLGFSAGTELVFTEINENSIDDINKEGWYICCKSLENENIIHCLEKFNVGHNHQIIRAKLVKSLRNEV